MICIQYIPLYLGFHMHMRNFSSAFPISVLLMFLYPKITWFCAYGRLFLLPIEKVEDIREVIGSCRSKDKHHEGQKKRYKRTTNDLQRRHIKLKIKQDAPGCEFKYSRRVSRSYSTCVDSIGKWCLTRQSFN